MSLTYSSYVNSLANLLVIPATDAGFVIDLPNIIDYGENRIYRDMDFISNVARDSSAALTAGNRNFTLPASTSTSGPTGIFNVVDEINIITPIGTTNPESGTRNALLPVSKEYLDYSWPSSTGSTVPIYFAMVTQTSVIMGPWPDAAYQVEVVGTRQPASLSVTNPTTFMSTYFPDLLIAASMVRASAFLKNYGAGVDDPKQAMTWEENYKTLLQSATTEENRKRFEGQGWSSKQPDPIATPPRT